MTNKLTTQQTFTHKMWPFLHTRIIYSIAISLLVLCTLIIIGKLLFVPACIPISTKDTACSYVIDGWSLAGIASTVMGVAATVLALLGAVAVAAWWADLEKRVDAKVNDLFEKHLQLINEQVEQKQQLVTNTQKELVEESKRTNKAITNLVLGTQLWEQKKREQALVLYKKAQGLRPRDPEINYTLGRAYKEFGFYREAQECLHVALEEDSAFGQAYTQLALATRFEADQDYQTSKDEEQRDHIYHEVVRLLNCAKELLPNDEEVLSTLGGTYRRQEKYALSLKYYQEAFTAHPNSSYARANVALLAFHEENIALAIQTYQEVAQVATQRLQSNVSDEPYWDYVDRGMAQLVIGKKDAALADYGQALLLNPPPGALQSIIDGLLFLQESKGKKKLDGLEEILSLIKNTLHKPQKENQATL